MPIGRCPTLLHYVLHAFFLGRGAAFHTTDDALYATTQVAKLEAGRIALPPSANVTELLVEIGCSDLMTPDRLPHRLRADARQVRRTARARLAAHVREQAQPAERHG